MWLAFGSSCIIQRNLWTSKVKWSGRKICRRCCKKNYYPLVAVFNGGGGVFGVGTSELVVIGIVAWVVLGPKRLYALSKDVGRIFGELRKSAEEAKTTLLTALESELEESTTKEKEEAQPSMETKVQEGAQWSDLLTQQKQNTTAVTQGNDAFDKDRKVFLRQMEQLESSNPQPPSEPPDILKKISTFGKEEETHSLDEKTDVETDLSNLDKKYWELRNEIVQRKKQQK